jgi:pimeloyl-CoA synthetase
MSQLNNVIQLVTHIQYKNKNESLLKKRVKFVRNLFTHRVSMALALNPYVSVTDSNHGVLCLRSYTIYAFGYTATDKFVF